jgi:hypothetical protein
MWILCSVDQLHCPLHDADILHFLFSGEAKRRRLPMDSPSSSRLRVAEANRGIQSQFLQSRSHCHNWQTLLLWLCSEFEGKTRPEDAIRVGKNKDCQCKSSSSIRLAEANHDISLSLSTKRKSF